MIRHILFPFDFSEQGVRAAPAVRALALRFEAAVTLLSVVPINFSVLPRDMESDLGGLKQALRDRLDKALGSELAGVNVTRRIDAGDPAERITTTAHLSGVELIMMPTHGLGLFRALLVGSATSKVLHDAQCPVWTATHAEQPRAAGVPRQILCAVDDAPESVAVLHWAARFSERVGAALEVLHVVELVADWPTPGSERAMGENLREESRARLTEMLTDAGIRGPLHVSVGDIVQRVTEHVREQKADLVVIGRGHASDGRMRTHVHGIIQRSACPVLSV